MPVAYTTPQYIGQPPSGYQDDRPYYFSSTSDSNSSSYRTAPSYPSSLSGSYTSAREPYPPVGGGRSDPRYAEKSYGSYPPRSLPSGQSKRYAKGYEPNPFGDFPDDASNASAPRYDDTGYDRKDNYPAGSSMSSQHKYYKDADDSHSNASKAYRDTSRDLTAPKTKSTWNGQAYDRLKGAYHYPEDHATLSGLAYDAAGKARLHADARTEFNQDHIGRVRKKHYSSHQSAAGDVYRSENKNVASALYHDERKSKPRYLG
ncbi:hypothetical protein MMC18_001180 [Xylographa bjoerkii]|nr:hypothetical protein [Xylographa bjoerkii]